MEIRKGFGGVVLRVNSPGVSAVQARIARAVTRLGI